MVHEGSPVDGISSLWWLVGQVVLILDWKRSNVWWKWWRKCKM